MSKMNLEHLRYLNSLAEDMKNSIFTRASILLAIIGVFLSILADNFITKWEIYKQFKLNHIVYIFVILTFILGCLAIYYTIAAIRPMPNNSRITKIITKKKKQKRVGELHSKFTMYNHITKIDRKQFLDEISNASDKDLSMDLIHSLYDLSHIIDYRYNKLHKANVYFLLMIISFLLSSSMIIFEYMFLSKIIIK